MAPRIDFVYLTHLFEEFERVADWQALIERATLPTVATDYAVGPALEHALVDLLGLDWETTEGYEGFYADYQEFVRLVRRKRNASQEQEVIQLHRLWRERGGISELSADMSLETVLRKFQGDFTHLIQGGQAMVGELYTLPIDPDRLNRGLANFQLGRGQIMFLAALAVVTGKYDYNAQKLPSTAQAAGTNIKALKWKQLPIDWRRGYAILRDMGDHKNWWQQFVGLDGYREFTFRYVYGDMKKGFEIASALLEMQGRGEIGEVLKWHELQLKTSDLVFIQQARSRPIIPVSISVPKELVGVITGQSFTGLEKMLPISSKPMTLVQGQGPQLVSAHTLKPHTPRPVVHRASRAIHSSDIVHAAAMFIRDHLIIDQGIKGALALAPEMEVAPVAANDDVEHTLHVVADTASVETDQLNPSPLADQSISPHLFGSAHLAPRAASHHVLRVVP